jgi:hypothetical protein
VSGVSLEATIDVSQPRQEAAPAKGSVLSDVWSARTGFFLGIWLFLLVGGRDKLFRDPGTFWHTVVGQRILSSGRFFETDPFSFTFSGKPWIPHQWLGECLMAVLDPLGGLDLLLLATATVLACLYSWVAHRLLRSGLHWLPALFLVVLTVAGSASHLHARPHLSTIIGLGVTFGWLVDFETRRIGLRRLCALVPVYWVWSNLHGGVLGGLATMGLAVLGWSLTGLLGLPTPMTRARQVPLLGLLVVACGATTLLNPYGLRLPESWFAIMGSPLLTRIIQEHAPLDPGSPEALIIFFQALIYAGVLASVRPWRPRVTWLIPLFWFYEAITRVRHAPLFCITSALAVAEMLPYSQLARWLARPRRDLFRFRAPEDASKAPSFAVKPALLPLGLIVLAALLQVCRVPAPILGSGWVRLDPEHWPTELLPELRQLEREHPEGARIFNDLLYGGFLIYYTPGIKVFIDDRCELYGDSRLAEFAEARHHHPERLEAWAREYGIDSAVVTRGTGFEAYLESSSDWTLIGRCRAASLFRRRPRTS